MIVLDSAGFSLLVPLIYGHAFNHQNQKEQLPGKGAASIQVSGADLKGQLGASLVAQWLRICLPMQGTRVRALVWEDPTYRRATGPVSHNC